MRQPWADLILAGRKDVENRSWPTALRGPLLIHAPRTIDWPAVARFHTMLGSVRAEDYQPVLGAIAGLVYVTACVTRHTSPFFSGPYGWTLAAPRRFARPVPWRGRLGIFHVPAGELPEIGTV